MAFTPMPMHPPIPQASMNFPPGYDMGQSLQGLVAILKGWFPGGADDFAALKKRLSGDTNVTQPPGYSGLNQQQADMAKNVGYYPNPDMVLPTGSTPPPSGQTPAQQMMNNAGYGGPSASQGLGGLADILGGLGKTAAAAAPAASAATTPPPAPQVSATPNPGGGMNSQMVQQAMQGVQNVPYMHPRPVGGLSGGGFGGGGNSAIQMALANLLRGNMIG